VNVNGGVATDVSSSVCPVVLVTVSPIVAVGSETSVPVWGRLTHANGQRPHGNYSARHDDGRQQLELIRFHSAHSNHSSANLNEVGRLKRK
jgi:hypothetical protein